MPADLKPLPMWRQHWYARRARRRAKWIEGRERRQKAYSSFKAAGRRGLTLAISLLGATLVGYGVWSIYAPAGFIVGGGLLWILQWNYGGRNGGSR